MRKDDQGPAAGDATEPGATPPVSGTRGTALRLVWLALVLGVASTAGYYALRGQRNDGNLPDGPPPAHPTLGLFHDWPKDRKPELVLLLSGQMEGYLQPCGCSRPQLGGLERRYNLIQSLKQRGWAVLPVDLGDLSKYKNLHQQALLKYTTTMRALKAMDYAAVGVGRHEFALPLFNGLANYSLQPGNERPRVLAANLLDREKQFPGADNKSSMVGAWHVEARDKQPAVGVVGLVGPSVVAEVQKIDRNIKFAENNAEVLRTALAEMAAHPARPELFVLLYQGTVAEATAAAKAFPQFRVLLCLTAEEEPPSVPTMVGTTMVIGVGHKGRHVGLVGVFKNGGKTDLHYQRAELGEDLETPRNTPEEANHPVLKLLQGYAETVKRDNYLKQYPKTPLRVQLDFKDQKVHYVGSDACKVCHAAEYEVWAKSKHAHAYEALEKVAHHPTLRNFDGECIVCHTVGFPYQTGYVDEKSTPHLKNVGCENCHGPGSLHMSQPLNRDLYATMSPWKQAPTDRMPAVTKLLKLADAKGPAQKQRILSPQEHAVMLRVDKVCQGCHDPDNDPHFVIEKAKYWPMIVHSNLKKKQPNGAPAEGAPAIQPAP